MNKTKNSIDLALSAAAIGSDFSATMDYAGDMRRNDQAQQEKEWATNPAKFLRGKADRFGNRRRKR